MSTFLLTGDSLLMEERPQSARRAQLARAGDPPSRHARNTTPGLAAPCRYANQAVNPPHPAALPFRAPMTPAPWPRILIAFEVVFPLSASVFRIAGEVL